MMNYVQYLKLISFITFVSLHSEVLFFPRFCHWATDRYYACVLENDCTITHEGAVTDRCTGIPVPDQTNHAHSSAPFPPEPDSPRYLCTWIWWVCSSAFRRTAASAVTVPLTCLPSQEKPEQAFQQEQGFLTSLGHGEPGALAGFAAGCCCVLLPVHVQ